MNNKNLMKVGVGIGVLALLYFAFKKKGTTAKSTPATKSDDSTIKTTKVEGGSISVDEKEFLDNVKRKTEIKAGDSPKMIAIKKFSAEVFTNPPKSEQDFLARASKAGLSKADLQSPEAQKMLNPFSNFDGDFNSKKRQKLRMKFGLSLEDDQKLTSRNEELMAVNPSESFDNDEERRQRFLRGALGRFAKKNKLNYEAFKNVEAGMKSRVKPTSVSGLAIAKRPRNYGTAQRPTRPLMGKKVSSMATSNRITETMDFDGGNDTLAAIM
jgi:hypothetical protein